MSRVQTTAKARKASRFLNTRQAYVLKKTGKFRSPESSKGGKEILPVVEEALKVPGRPLDPETRGLMESRFGHDLSRVRIHTDEKAAEAARVLGARAYTVGRDIFFAEGSFDPRTEEGKHLLAHELAHTLQQGSVLEPGLNPNLPTEGEGRFFEGEADRTAEKAMEEKTPEVETPDQPLSLTPTGKPLVSMAPGDPPAPQTPPASGPPAGNGAPAGTANMAGGPAAGAQEDLALAAGTVKATRQNTDQSTEVFSVDPFFLPVNLKGDVAPAYNTAAAAGRLKSILMMKTPTSGGSRKSEVERTVKLTRDDTAVMKRNWLWVSPRRIQTADANAKWHEAGGAAQFPKLTTSPDPCEMDHVQELQLNGTNNAENLQVLDRFRNGQSGTQISDQVKGLAHAIADNPRLSTGTSDRIQLVFTRVVPTGSVPGTDAMQDDPASTTTPKKKKGTNGPSVSAAMTENIRNGAAATPGGTGAAVKVISFAPVLSGTAARIEVPANLQLNQTWAIYDDPTNREAAGIIPGMRLIKFKQGGGAVLDRIMATLDYDQVPITIPGEDSRRILFEIAPPASAGGSGALVTGPRAEQAVFNNSSRSRDAARNAEIVAERTGQNAEVLRQLRILNGNPNFPMDLRGWSPGRLTQVSLTSDGKLNWRGTLQPSLRFLPSPLDLVYENDSLKISRAVDPSKFRSPIPGLTVTRADIGVTIVPPVSADGTLAFVLGNASHPLASGEIRVGANLADGIFAEGTLHAHIPRVDDASATVRYRNGHWTGRIVIQSSQIHLPYVQSAELALDLDEHGLHPSGQAVLLLPSELGTITVGFHKEGERFIFTGDGNLHVHGLNPFQVHARYDGDTFTASANNVGFTWNSLTGTLNVTVRVPHSGHPAVTGDGTLTLQRGDFTGTITVHRDEQGNYSGRGTMSYGFDVRGHRVVATATIVITPDHDVHVEGAVRLADPIELFRRFENRYQFFHLHRDIPIPGVSIGPLGIQAVIEAGLSANYYFGPGQLRDIELRAAFNPLHPDPDPNINFHCVLDVPAHVGLEAMFGGGLGLSLGIGEVSGTIRITAGLGLNGGAGGSLDVGYQHHQFIVEAVPEIHAELALDLGLSAHAEATALHDIIHYEKNWQLGQPRHVVLGAFSVAAPIRWTSADGLRVPSASDLRWGPSPDINFRDVLHQLMDGSGRENHT